MTCTLKTSDFTTLLDGFWTYGPGGRYPPLCRSMSNCCNTRMAAVSRIVAMVQVASKYDANLCDPYRLSNILQYKMYKNFNNKNDAAVRLWRLIVLSQNNYKIESWNIKHKVIVYITWNSKLKVHHKLNPLYPGKLSWMSEASTPGIERHKDHTQKILSGSDRQIHSMYMGAVIWVRKRCVTIQP